MIATSTKTDILDVTRSLRAKKGPVWVFDPDGLTADGSTITFDPLTGCANPVTAAERATDMIAASSNARGGHGDRAYWDGQARRVLAAMITPAARVRFVGQDEPQPLDD